MVCLGNICRSPLADGILRFKVKQNNLDIIVDSAGTYSGHKGENPDPRAIAVAKKYGIDISYLVARPFIKNDFHDFDKIYVMDSSNYRDVLKLATCESDEHKVEMIMNVVNPGKNQSVPDPYFGGNEGFEEVFKMLNEACDKVIQQLK